MGAAMQKVMDVCAMYGLSVLSALIILVVGWVIARIVSGIVEKLMTRANVEPTIATFTHHLVYIGALTFVIIAALGKLGIQTTQFIAVLGAAGLAVGLALQGSLANFAAGFLMIIFRPFKVGDFVEAAGTSGTVEAMQIFTTQIKTPDNKTVIVPNAKITGDNITNYSAKGTRRVDMVVGIAYDADIDKAKQVIEEILTADERVLKDPPLKVAVVELADSSVNLVVRPWVNAADYWDVHFETTEAVKKRLDAEGIGISFPQRDVHLYKHEG